jgi:hypothetical protein
VIFRNFLYLDENLVQQSVAQVDAGVFEEQTITQKSSRDGKLGGGLRLGPASGTAERGRESSEEVSQVLRQTPESQYNRLHNWLEESGGITEIFANDEAVWQSLRPGEAVAIQCDIEIPATSRFLSSPDEMEAIARLAGMFGQGLDESQRAAFEGISALSRSSEQRVVVIGAIDDDAPRIVAALRQSSLRASFEELETEATVVGILSKKIPAGERHLLFNLPGMNLLPRAERRRMAQATNADPSSFIEGPLGIITPLAVF